MRIGDITTAAVVLLMRMARWRDRRSWRGCNEREHIHAGVPCLVGQPVAVGGLARAGDQPVVVLRYANGERAVPQAVYETLSGVIDERLAEHLGSGAPDFRTD